MYADEQTDIPIYVDVPYLPVYGAVCIFVSYGNQIRRHREHDNHKSLSIKSIHEYQQQKCV